MVVRTTSKPIPLPEISVIKVWVEKPGAKIKAWIWLGAMVSSSL